eukprot:TRINITY_DN2464_c0_g1_i1.p1 TRINITY_DN2464_c0_g1~~TRINITY_DN2464_c0_g1_i1.p1  ORF type:complete len:428 (-),score=112.21 TRINITY_DN2464_c0_g1_i1:287-1570(-)
MEIQKTKDELIAFLESSGANSLVDFLGSSSSVNLAVADELDEIESSASSSEVEETIEDAKEEGRDDEDFIILMEPKNKKKIEKRSISAIVKPNVPKSKRKCEFCGTMETPMWRRGPTGKGTLCNACGVKWSLKFRKRAGKKASKVEKISRDDGSQQRQSSRKKIPSKKSSDEPADSIADCILKEDSSSSNHHHVGLCCNHSKKRKDRDDEDGQDWRKRSRDANQEYDSLSDDASPQSHQLFGKLLNVVEVQLVEEEELERIKAQIRILRKDLESNENSRERELTQIKAESLEHLLKLKSEILGLHVDRIQDKVVKECSDMLHNFMKNVRCQLDEARKTLSHSSCDGIDAGLTKFESEANHMTEMMDANFAKLTQKTSSDLLRLQTMFLNQEDSIKSRWSMHQKDTKSIFAPLHDRMEIIEDPIMKSL